MIQPIRDDLSRRASIEWELLRLDLLHPIVSGNKYFKLGPYLEMAAQQQSPGLVGFGGAWSNHIHALAYAAKERGLGSIGLIRGEEPAGSNDMLADCRRWGMDLRFLSRRAYRQLTDAYKSATPPAVPLGPFGSSQCVTAPSDPQEMAGNPSALTQNLETMRSTPIAPVGIAPTEVSSLFGTLSANWLIIPEGGYGIPGMEGASRIWNHIPQGRYTHILCAVGTGTMIAGLALGKQRLAKQLVGRTEIPLPVVIGLPVLQHGSLEKEIDQILQYEDQVEKPLLIHRFHGGGYAKTNPELFDFMRNFYRENGVPTDQVYTAKLLMGIQQLIQEGFFPSGSRLLAIHSGGLQGNRSLKKGILPY